MQNVCTYLKRPINLCVLQILKRNESNRTQMHLNYGIKVSMFNKNQKQKNETTLTKNNCKKTKTKSQTYVKSIEYA